jgi:hypothetical protein
MNTRKYKTHQNPHLKNKTKKNRTLTPIPKPEIKTVPPNKSMYASKTYKGDEILKHAKKEEEKTHNHCVKDNITWLSNYEVAKLYKNESNHLYKWKINKPTRLIKTTPKNETFFERIFKNSTHDLEPIIKSPPQESQNHKYFKMTPNEKALYEFKFVFGYLTIQEQYEFLNLLKHVKNIKINQIVLSVAINYYRLNLLFPTKTQTKTPTKTQKATKKTQNRISFYEIDKHVVNNLCKALQESKQFQNIEGLYQSSKIKSFWYPSFLKYSKNLEEFILFNPQHELTYVGVIE